MAVVQLTPKEQLMDYLYLKNDEFDLCDFDIYNINYDKNINYLNKSIELKCISAIQHKINDILAEADNLDPINSNNNIDSMNTVITCLNDVDKIVPLPCTLNHINYINEIKQL